MKPTFLALALLGLLTLGCSPLHKVAAVPIEPAVPIALQVPTPVPVDPTPKVTQSIARLAGMGLFGGERPVTWGCTAFSIAPRKYLTAAHCTAPLHQVVAGNIKLDNRPAFIIAEDEVNDIAIVVADYVQPALTIRVEPLQRYDKVQAMGFGYDFLYPLRTDHIVMILNYSPAEGIAPGTMYLHPFVGGMSGGPVYDRNGDVVGMVQRSNEVLAYGIASDVLIDFLSKN